MSHHYILAFLMGAFTMSIEILIFSDAFNDVSVPYHLTTREFGENVKAHLTDHGF